jgi:hypothetical protein
MGSCQDHKIMSVMNWQTASVIGGLTFLSDFPFGEWNYRLS